MGLFSYKGNRIVYWVGTFVVRHLTPGPNYVTVKTKYGILLMPKSLRVFTMKYDLLEPEIKAPLEDFMAQMDCFINIGTAEGYYLLKARALNQRARIIGFEPDKRAYSVLLANLSMNNLLDAVDIFDFALSDKDGQPTEIQTCMGSGKMISVSRRLDSVQEERNFQITAKSLILIDVEGLGISVLRGATRILSRRSPRIVMELHPGEEEAESFLTSLGYDVVRPSEFFLIATRSSN